MPRKKRPKVPPRRRPRDERRRQLLESPINPDWFYRLSDGQKFFGFGPSRLAEKIATGEIPKPISLSDSGRARGWFGRVILRWQQERERAAEAVR
jgi:hypothetical protein